MSIKPEGESIRNAVKWISAERQENASANLTKLVDEACLKFNLSPKEGAFLLRFVKEEQS
jgi:hypothetical protein